MPAARRMRRARSRILEMFESSTRHKTPARAPRSKAGGQDRVRRSCGYPAACAVLCCAGTGGRGAVTSNPSDLYPVVAQIAATFAGFGSLASGLGQRQGGADPRMDAYRLSLMLFASLSATMLGLLPAMLGALSLSPVPAL